MYRLRHYQSINFEGLFRLLSFSTAVFFIYVIFCYHVYGVLGWVLIGRTKGQTMAIPLLCVVVASACVRAVLVYKKDKGRAGTPTIPTLKMSRFIGYALLVSGGLYLTSCNRYLLLLVPYLLVSGSTAFTYLKVLKRLKATTPPAYTLSSVDVYHLHWLVIALVYYFYVACLGLCGTTFTETAGWLGAIPVLMCFRYPQLSTKAKLFGGWAVCAVATTTLFQDKANLFAELPGRLYLGAFTCESTACLLFWV